MKMKMITDEDDYLQLLRVADGGGAVTIKRFFTVLCVWTVEYNLH